MTAPGASARPPLAFRSAQTGDVAVLVGLVESAYRGEASRAGWTTEADLLDGQRIDAAGIGALLAAHDSQIVLALAEGAILACAHLQRQPDGAGAYFGMFAVRPQLQGGGQPPQVSADVLARRLPATGRGRVGLAKMCGCHAIAPSPTRLVIPTDRDALRI